MDWTDLCARFANNQLVDAHLSHLAVLFQVEPLGKQPTQHHGHLFSCPGSCCSSVDIVFALVKPAWTQYLIQLQMVSLRNQALQGDIFACDPGRRVRELIVIVRPDRVLTRPHRGNVKHRRRCSRLTKGHRTRKRERKEEAPRVHRLQHIRAKTNLQTTDN